MYHTARYLQKENSGEVVLERSEREIPVTGRSIWTRAASTRLEREGNCRTNGAVQEVGRKEFGRGSSKDRMLRCV